MSCERPRQVYAQISISLGRSQLVYRRVAHNLKVRPWKFLICKTIQPLPVKVGPDDLLHSNDVSVESQTPADITDHNGDVVDR